MQVLTKLSTLGMCLADMEYPNARHVLSYRLSELLLEHTGREFETKSILLGVSNPDAVLYKVREWNTSMRDECMRQLNNLTMADPSPMPCNPAISKVMPILENMSGDYSPEGMFLVIYEPEFLFQKPILRSYVQRDLLLAIEKEPAPYIIADGETL